jgi:hypothetical protein
MLFISNEEKKKEKAIRKAAEEALAAVPGTKGKKGEGKGKKGKKGSGKNSGANTPKEGKGNNSRKNTPGNSKGNTPSNTPPVQKKDKPCRLHAEGKCTFGDNCWFSHDELLLSGTVASLLATTTAAATTEDFYDDGDASSVESTHEDGEYPQPASTHLRGEYLGPAASTCVHGEYPLSASTHLHGEYLSNHIVIKPPFSENGFFCNITSEMGRITLNSTPGRCGNHTLGKNVSFGTRSVVTYMVYEAMKSCITAPRDHDYSHPWLMAKTHEEYMKDAIIIADNLARELGYKSVLENN